MLRQLLVDFSAEAGSPGFRDEDMTLVNANTGGNLYHPVAKFGVVPGRGLAARANGDIVRPHPLVQHVLGGKIHLINDDRPDPFPLGEIKFDGPACWTLHFPCPLEPHHDPRKYVEIA